MSSSGQGHFFILFVRKKNKLDPFIGIQHIFFAVNDYSPATIAPIGQASAQVPQSIQALGSIV
jgi:hypothetical protein